VPEAHARTLDATLLLVGEGVLTDALAPKLLHEGVEVQRTNGARAAQAARVTVPDLLVIAGDSAADAGQRVLAELALDPTTATLPTVVIVGPALAAVGISMRANVAALAPAGGLAVCAGHIHALLVAVCDGQLEGRALQQVLDAAMRPQAEAPVATSVSAEPAAEAAWAEDSPLDAHTPLAWSNPAEPVAAPESLAPRPVRRGPRAFALLAAAAMLAIGAVALAGLSRRGLRAETHAARAALGAAAPQPSPSPAVTPTITPAPARPAAAPEPPVATAIPTAVPAPEPTVQPDTPPLDDEAPALEDEPTETVNAPEATRQVNAAYQLLERGQLEPAEAAYRKALALLPHYPRALAGLVRVQLERKNGPEAVRWAEQLVAAQPKRGNNQLLLGDAYALSGDSENARKAWHTSSLYGNTTAWKRLH
jgi:hypothetical protein